MDTMAPNPEPMDPQMLMNQMYEVGLGPWRDPEAGVPMNVDSIDPRETILQPSNADQQWGEIPVPKGSPPLPPPTEGSNTASNSGNKMENGKRSATTEPPEEEHPAKRHATNSTVNNNPVQNLPLGEGADELGGTDIRKHSTERLTEPPATDLSDSTDESDDNAVVRKKPRPQHSGKQLPGKQPRKAPANVVRKRSRKQPPKSKRGCVVFASQGDIFADFSAIALTDAQDEKMQVDKEEGVQAGPHFVSSKHSLEHSLPSGAENTVEQVQGRASGFMLFYLSLVC